MSDYNDSCLIYGNPSAGGKCSPSGLEITKIANSRNEGALMEDRSHYTCNRIIILFSGSQDANKSLPMKRQDMKPQNSNPCDCLEDEHKAKMFMALDNRH